MPTVGGGATTYKSAISQLRIPGPEEANIEKGNLHTRLGVSERGTLNDMN